MGYPAYLLQQIDASCSLSAESEDAGEYGLECLYDENPAKPFRFTVVTGGWIEIDFGAAVTLDGVALVNHNFESSVTVSVYAGAAPAPGALVGTVTYREGDMYAQVTETTARYWRIDVDDDNTAVTEIGELILGLFVELPAYNDSDIEETDEQKIRHETQGGKRYTYDLYTRTLLTLDFGPFEPDVRDTFRTLHGAVLGDAHPFLLVPDLELDDCYYGRKEPTCRLAGIGEYDLYTYAMNFSTDSRGETIIA